MDLRQLRYFLAIVEEGSISNAAKRGNVAQPALSVHMRKLEAELGAQLLVRGPRGVTPTDAGDLLANRARTLLSDMERLKEEVRSLGQEPVGTVRLGLPGTISSILALPLIVQCRERYPRIKIIVAEAMSGFVREWLFESRIDIAVLYVDLKGTGVRSQALLDEELVLLMPATVADDCDPYEAIKNHGLILPSGAHGLRKVLDNHLSIQGLSIDPVIEVDSYANIKQLVESGFGCSILPYHSVRAEVEKGQLRIQNFIAPTLSRCVWLAQSTSRPQTQAARAVSDLLVEIVDQLVQDNSWAGASKPLGEAKGA
jgi:LysR family nitrogen assimilation transcriptional regulator